MCLILDFVYPYVTEGFPYFPDLVCAGSRLSWHVLFGIEPRWSGACVHVGEDLGRGCMEELGDSRRVYVHPTIVEDFDLLFIESIGVGGPLHDVDVMLSFGWYDILSVQLDFERGFIQSISE